MPFKSEAQRRKFGELVQQGKMSQKTFDEWNKDTPPNIPKRVSKKSDADGSPRSVDDLQSIYKKRFGL